MSKVNKSSTKPSVNANSFGSTFTINSVARQSESDPDVVLFDGGQEITNGTVQKDLTHYDIPTLDTDSHSGKLYNDHSYGWQDVLGKLINVIKDVSSDRVTLGGIKFAKSGLAQAAKQAVLDGMAEFSIGTLGATDDDGLRKNHRMIELSLVGLGNNDYTSLNDFAVKNGFINSEKGDAMTFKAKNNNTFAVKVKYNDADDKEVETEVPAGAEVEVPSEETQTAVQEQLDGAEKPQAAGGESTDDNSGDDKSGADDKSGTDTKADNAADTVSKADFDALKNSLDKLQKSMNTPAKPVAGSSEDTNSLGTGAPKMNEVQNMSAGERLFKQIQLERSGNKNSAEFAAINEFNTQELMDKNALTDAPESLGGLVPPFELLDRIVSCETNYDAFLNLFGFNEAGLTYAWNVGIGDVEFTPVGYCDPSAESDFETALENRTQERLATHTVICNKLSRFSPVNVINIVASRYQTAYKRALAQFVIAELEVAVDKRVAGWNRTAGTDVPADANGSVVYDNGSATQTEKATALLSLFTNLSDCVLGGVYIMNAQTAAKLIMDLNLGASGILSNGGTVAVNDYSRLGVALGGQVVVVPNDLLPTLGSGASVTIPRSAEAGGNVTVNHAIFYTAPSNWYGVTNGALQFDIDSFGSYETTVQKTVGGGGTGTITVTETHSAKQRGETVLFGEMYRGGGFLDFRTVGGILA